MDLIYSVGYFDPRINNWYHNGDFGTEEQAKDVAQRTANAKVTRARVTNLSTEKQEFFDPNPQPRITYRKVGPTSWVAYNGRQAIWEDTTEAKLRNMLKRQMGLTNLVYERLTIVVCR